MANQDPKLVLHLTAKEKADFLKVTQHVGMTISEALRRAIALWTKTQRGIAR